MRRRALALILVTASVGLGACGGDSRAEQENREKEIAAKLEAELPEPDFATPEGTTIYVAPGGTCNITVVGASPQYIESAAVRDDPGMVLAPDGSAVVGVGTNVGHASEEDCKEPVREVLGW